MTRGTSQLTTKKDGNRPPINGDTPVANKTLRQCLNAILDTSSWIQLFAPKAARQAVWAVLVEELSYPVNSTSTSQRFRVFLRSRTPAPGSVPAPLPERAGHGLSGPRVSAPEEAQFQGNLCRPDQPQSVGKSGRRMWVRQAIFQTSGP
ncbi:hypothetical protein PHMEG_00022610 [Phytophthora megakarya]|uniref:Eukaryotic/viral aspartic protease n=1 Tax=Phytophthora megakarya TaxID=4795 RepID=A0A225VLB4_9STRA|nr:hypothetical protein PHMEG_00022610 [Phytophthora megakarya]